MAESRAGKFHISLVMYIHGYDVNWLLLIFKKQKFDRDFSAFCFNALLFTLKNTIYLDIYFQYLLNYQLKDIKSKLGPRSSYMKPRICSVSKCLYTAIDHMPLAIWYEFHFCRVYF